METGHHRSGFQPTAFQALKKMCKVSALNFHAGILGDRLLGSYVLPPRLTRLFTTFSYEISVHSCCKLCTCRLGFIYVSCVMALHHIFSLQLWKLLATCFWNNRQDEVDHQHGLLVPPI